MEKENEEIQDVFSISEVNSKWEYLQQPNTITFHIDQKEVLRLEGEGNIYVNGRLADNDKEVVEAMKFFLSHVVEKINTPKP